MKNHKIIFAAFAGCALLLSACSPALLPKSEAYPAFYEEKPVSILIMPPINRTTNVEAKEFFHTTLNEPLTNAGYYVIPPFLSMEMLKRESAYDSELFMDKSLTKFGEVFGADLVLFTVIKRWEKAALLGTITVEVEYIIKSAKTNETLYNRNGQITVDASTSSSGQSALGMLVSMAVTAIQTAVTDHAIVGAVCSNATLQDLPAGPYSPLNGKDGSQTAGNKNFNMSVKGNAKSIRTETSKWYTKYTGAR